MKKATVYVDGASRGNPGPAAYAYVIQEAGEPPIEKSEYLGDQTNNIAEYSALRQMLHDAVAMGFTDLHVYSDSELMVKQVRGEFKVKNPQIFEIWQEVRKTINKLDHFQIDHVLRGNNKRADELCNIELDRVLKKPGSSAAKPKPATKTSSSKQVSPEKEAYAREECLICIEQAMHNWNRGEAVPTPEQLWDQLWSILDDANILKKS
ncbi:MAG: ribonuclease HI family protein [Zavarzinella sp.]